MFVGVFTLVVFPTVACFFDRGERHKDRVLTRFFSIYDLILLVMAVASYRQAFIVYA